MYDKNQIEDSLEFIRQMKDFYESSDFLTDFDPMEGHGDDELFANLAENLEQKNRLMESVTQGVQTSGASLASSEQEKRRQLEEQRLAEERRAAQEEWRLIEEERKRLQREIRQRELQERQRVLEEERKRQTEIEAERKRIEKERQAALEEQRKQEELRKQIEEERKRFAAEQKLAAERRAAEEKLAAERRAVEEERRRQAEIEAERKRIEKERQAALEEQRKQEELRKQIEEERRRLAAEKERQAALEEQRKIEEERRRLAAEQKLAAERRAAEEKLAAERRAAEEKLAAERRAAEEERRRIEEERQRLVEERLQREIEEQRRLVAEQRRREEEEKRRREAEEKKRRQELVLAEQRRRQELEEEERRQAAREQEEKIAAEKKRQEAIANQASIADESSIEEAKPEASAQEEVAIAAAPIINIAAQNTSTPNASLDKPNADTEVSRLQKRAEELQRQAEMANLEARMRQLQLESQAAHGVYPQPQINIPNAGNASITAGGAAVNTAAANAAVPFAQISIPGAANNGENGNNSPKKMSKEEIDNIFLQELEKFQGDDENASARMKSGHPLQKYINNFDGKTFSSLIPAEKLLDVGYKVKDVVDDQIWNIKHFIQKKINNSGDIEAQQKTKKILSNLLVVAVCVFFAYLIAMMITHFVAHPTKVEGESMETTLTNGDTVVIQKMSYYLGHPERYDVVVFPVPNYNSKTYYIKRVIGLPGETVQIKDGKVYIDNKELDSDKYGKEDYINDPGDVAEPITLAKNEYFVLGDNRNMSTDSRSSYVGMVKERYIIGKAWERIWPLSKIGSIGK